MFIKFINWIKHFFTNVATSPATTQTDSPVPSKIPPQDGSGVSVIKNITLIVGPNCTEEEASRIPIILQKIYDVINSEKFGHWLLDPKNGLDLNQTNEMTRDECLVTLRTKNVTAVVDFYYQRWTSTVGYRNEGENVIHCNRKFHDSFTITDEASNVCHELSHLMGFDHDFNATARRPYSLPYTINRYFDTLKD